MHPHVLCADRVAEEVGESLGEQRRIRQLLDRPVDAYWQGVHSSFFASADVPISLFF